MWEISLDLKKVVDFNFSKKIGVDQKVWQILKNEGYFSTFEKCGLFLLFRELWENTVRKKNVEDFSCSEKLYSFQLITKRVN